MDLNAAPLRDSLRRPGWRDGLLYLLAEGLRRASRGRVRLFKYYLMVQPLDAGPVLPAHRGRSVRVLEADPGALRRMPSPARRLELRFDQGARCLLAEREGRFAGYFWYVAGPYREDEVRCRFVPEPADCSVWDFDVYVVPDERSGVVFARLWDAALHHLRAQGMRYSYSRISAFNPASLAAHRRLGARLLGRSLFLCIGPWQLLHTSGGQGWHLSRSEREIPQVRLRPF